MKTYIKCFIAHLIFGMTSGFLSFMAWVAPHDTAIETFCGVTAAFYGLIALGSLIPALVAFFDEL